MSEQSLKQPSPLETVDSFASSGTEKSLCHQTMTSRECIGCSIDAAGECPLTDKDKNILNKPEQPNTELLIVKTIQGLTTCISNELVKLPTTNTTLNIERIALRAKALEEIDLFEKTTLFELQKAFE